MNHLAHNAATVSNGHMAAASCISDTLEKRQKHHITSFNTAATTLQHMKILYKQVEIEQLL